jgi:hypothetical protein
MRSRGLPHSLQLVHQPVQAAMSGLGIDELKGHAALDLLESKWAGARANQQNSEQHPWKLSIHLPHFKK